MRKPSVTQSVHQQPVRKLTGHIFSYRNYHNFTIQVLGHSVPKRPTIGVFTRPSMGKKQETGCILLGKDPIRHSLREVSKLRIFQDKLLTP